jgi:hypothetical protein
MDLYYYLCILEPLVHELHTKMNLNSLKTTFLLVYICFVKFEASFQHIKTSNAQNYFESCPLFEYIIFIMFRNLYNTNGIERLIQMY